MTIVSVCEKHPEVLNKTCSACIALRKHWDRKLGDENLDMSLGRTLQDDYAEGEYCRAMGKPVDIGTIFPTVQERREFSTIVKDGTGRQIPRAYQQ
jgi:hypothetical protein